MATAARRSESYVYLPIADALKAVGQKVNIFGLVAGAGAAKRSRGTDYFVTLRVIDQSYPSQGILVNFFSKEPDNLPQVRSVGDIITLRKIKIEVHGKRFCGVFFRDSSSYALFDMKATDGLNHYQAGTKYCADDHDKEFIQQLRLWFSNVPLIADLDEQALPIRQIQNNLTCNLVCKVLHVFETSERKCILFVWDGTDFPPGTFDNDLDLEEETVCLLDFGGLTLSREVVCGFPRIGSVLSVITGKAFEELSHLQGNGQWVKLWNITCEFESGFWKVMLQSSSKVDILSDEDWVVRRRQKLYDFRFASRLECRPVVRFPRPYITELNCGRSTYATLRESIIYPKVNHRFTCIVRVVAACPYRAEDLRSPVTGEYRVRLTLEDPTARIHAYVIGGEGMRFFNGDQAASEGLTGTMKKLLGITDLDGQVREDGRRDPPWIWCRLKSYFLKENDVWGTRRYQMFGTRFNIGR